MGTPLERRKLLDPLTGSITDDDTVVLELGDVAMIKVVCVTGSAGSLLYTGAAGTVANGDILAAGDDSGWLDVQERLLQLKRDGGDADYKIHRIGYPSGG